MLHFFCNNKNFIIIILLRLFFIMAIISNKPSVGELSCLKRFLYTEKKTSLNQEEFTRAKNIIKKNISQILKSK